MLRLDLIKQSVASAPGTGAISLGSGQTGFIGIQDHPDTTDGMLVEYIAIDGDNKEFGIGTYAATGDVLTRTWIQGKIESSVYSKNPGTGVNLTANAVIQCGSVATNINFKGCLVYPNSVQAIPSGTVTPIAFQSESYDTHAFHDAVTNNTRITIQSGKGISKVSLKANCIMNIASGTVNNVIFSITKNGDYGPGLPRHQRAKISDTYVATSLPTAAVPVVAGDYFELTIYQDSGVSQNTYNLDGYLWFALEVVE